MEYKKFYEKVVKLWEQGFFSLTIRGKRKEVKAMAEYITVSGLQYIKIVFSDRSFLYLPKDEEALYYSEEYIVDTGVSDEDIGVKEELEFKWKKYYLENKDDYQFVKRFYLWDIGDIEWEVKFSDYCQKDGDDILSLGWIVCSMKRADVNPRVIDLGEVGIVE